MYGGGDGGCSGCTQRPQIRERKRQTLSESGLQYLSRDSISFSGFVFLTMVTDLMAEFLFYFYFYSISISIPFCNFEQILTCDEYTF